MTGADAYTDWDAAYVLGALAPAERAEFERHLAGCEVCRRAVGELAGLPGLLGALPADEALAVLDDDTEELDGGAEPSGPAAAPAGAGSPALAPLIERVRRGRRRRRLAAVVGAGLGVAAVIALLLAVVIPSWRTPQQLDVTFSAATPGVPISATAELAERDGGTRISSSCAYGAADYSDGSGGGAERAFALYVTSASGDVEQVASWMAAPGDTVEATAWTDVPIDAIAELDIREAGTPDALLRAPMP